MPAKKKPVKKLASKKAAPSVKGKKPIAKKMVATKKPVKKLVSKSKVVAAPKKTANAKPVLKSKIIAKAKPVVKAKVLAKKPVKALPKSRPLVKAKVSAKVTAKPAPVSSKKSVPVVTKKAPPVVVKKPVISAAQKKLNEIKVPKVQKFIVPLERSSLTAGELKHLYSLLNAEYLKLLEEADSAVEQMRNESQEADVLDQAANESQNALLLRAGDRARKLARKIERAMQRIKDDPTYGLCTECGINIGYPRLEVRPMADYCLACKEVQEKGELVQGEVTAAHTYEE